eukprot:TRINITY_DN12141_c0_g1_i1.p1 TRINITY_DN12141_c0_g1~~TRINITY_DN12141_c0_g1_i1.p1  ORF type:complete len:283 (-),score=72.27 TRINITY_DN12141_c0_g1_i1:7-855(-)
MTYISFSWIDPSQWSELAYDIVHFLLCLCYIGLFLVSVYMFRYFRYQSSYFKAIFLLGVFVRVIYFLSLPLIRESVLVISQPVEFVINTLPAFIFFSAYMLLLMFWVELYHVQKISSAIQLTLVATNVVMYAAVVALYGLDFHSLRDTPPDSAISPFENAVLILILSLYVLFSIGFFAYGYYSFKYGRGASVQFRSGLRRRIMRKIGFITLVCMAAFLLRAGMVLWNVLQPALFGDRWWIDAIYYVVLEVVPTCLMLGAYLEPAAAEKQRVRDETSPLIVDI